KLNKYILTRHAEERMRERNISEKEVEKALRNPDMNYPGKSGEINIIKQIKEDKKIRVVYREEKMLKIIITAIVIN
ncbi:MAG: DUF4258 domain-containing protein, partial [Candidatus Aminicenantes bacterium]|nr:DUF4258 domain-containing protein [Candidatus Aminicenantes bacterium]